MLERACVLSHFSHVWLYSTLWTVACQAPLSVGFSRQEYWSGSPCPPPGDLPNVGIKPAFLSSSAMAGGFFTTIAWEAHHVLVLYSFMWSNIIPFYELPCYLYPFVNRHLVCLCHLTFMNNAVYTHLHAKSFCFILFYFSCVRVEFLSHMVALCLTFWGNATLFSKVILYLHPHQ